VGRGGARALVGVGLAALMAMILPSCAPVTAFTVDDTTDLVDASPGDGLCASSAGTCTLRAAIQEGNATAGGGASITLQSGATYALSIAGAGDDAAATGDLDVVGPITLHGNGATVDARGLDRVVQVLPTGALTADHLTITGGTAPYGGGVRIDLGGHATITSATISANQATGLTECDIQGGTITSCTTETTGAAEFPPQEGGGAGLWNRGTLGLSQSTVSGNTAAPNACFLRGLRTLDGWCDYSLGGGLLNTGTALVLTSTISGTR
jgi:CSLREA domain-containing protein